MRLSGQDRSFRHNGLYLEAGWQEFDTLTAEQRECLRAYFGTHVRVHPADLDQLANFGLRMQTDDDGNPHHRKPLVDIVQPAKDDKSDAKKTDNKATADRGDGKKAKDDKSDAKKEG